MRARKYHILAEWLNNTMIFLIVFMSAEWIFGMLKVETMPIHAVVLGFIIVCSYLSRVYIEKLLLFIGVHCLELIFLVFIPLSVPYKVMGLLVFGIISLNDLFFWTGGNVRSFNMVHPVAVTVMLSAFAYASWHEIPGLIRGSYISGILFVALFFIRTYLLNAVHLADDMQVNASTPLEEMFKNNGTIVVTLVAVFTAIMFLVRSDSAARYMRSGLHLLAQQLRKVLIFIISLFMRGGTGETGGGETGAFEMELLPQSPTPIWLITLLQVIEKILIILFLAAVIYFVLKGIFMFIRMYYLRHGYDMKMMESDDHIDLDERIRHDHKRHAARKAGIRSERERVRRKYRREVENLRRNGYVLKRDHTPSERAIDVAREDFKKLTKKYENLRYDKL